jgi:hypothetical protein
LGRAAKFVTVMCSPRYQNPIRQEILIKQNLIERFCSNPNCNKSWLDEFNKNPHEIFGIVRNGLGSNKNPVYTQENNLFLRRQVKI